MWFVPVVVNHQQVLQVGRNIDNTKNVGKKNKIKTRNKIENIKMLLQIF